MTTFLGITKPSQALEAMVDGLLASKDNPNFRAEMDTYGDAYEQADGPLCFGCAATCTLQQLAGARFTPDSIRRTQSRAEVVGVPAFRLGSFEHVMNSARRGKMHALLRFFDYYDPRVAPSDYYDPSVTPSDGKFCLKTDDWEAQLPAVRAVIKEMKEAGL